MYSDGFKWSALSFEEEDGSMLIDLAGDYYGEVDFQMQYKDVKGDTFDWLYIDFQTLSLYASECGFKAKLIKEGKHYDYLAKLSLAWQRIILIKKSPIQDSDSITSE